MKEDIINDVIETGSKNQLLRGCLKNAGKAVFRWANVAVVLVQDWDLQWTEVGGTVKTVDRREPETKGETQGQQMETANGQLGYGGTQVDLTWEDPC